MAFLDIGWGDHGFDLRIKIEEKEYFFLLPVAPGTFYYLCFTFGDAKP
jgi:hypothetical protein